MRGKIIGACVVACGLVLGTPGAASAKTPKPCLTALDHAENVVGINREFAQAISDYFGKNAAAATANSSGTITGVTAFLNALTSNTTDLRSTIEDLTTRVGPEVTAYRTAASACRKG